MKSLILVWLLAALAWAKPYESKDFHFSVIFPAAVTQKNIQGIESFSSEVGQATYVVGAWKPKARTGRDGAFAVLRDAMPGLSLGAPRKIEAAGALGYEMGPKLENRFTTMAQVWSTANLSYFVVATSTKPEDVKNFMASFKLK